MSEWDDYNETLTQVLTWLLQAETQLKQQEPVSDIVDQVKEQFRQHEVRADTPQLQKLFDAQNIADFFLKSPLFHIGVLLFGQLPKLTDACRNS